MKKNVKALVQKAVEEGRGVLRLQPCWVPRSFCRPGKRIKLHPDHYYKLGLKRGGIDERWLSSATHADNGPGTPDDEGLSYIAIDEEGNEKVLLRDAVEYFGKDIIGEDIWNKYGRWPMFSKFFDNMGPLPHHIHHRDNHAGNVGQSGKPEMYFFPSQMNNHGGEFPFTFFGFNPGTKKNQVKNALEGFTKGDNKILDISRAYRLTPDTGWDVPPGILHAPGSLCTYEPQFASDVYAMYQSVLYGGQCVPEELLWKDCPPERKGDFDYLMEVIDWEANTDPDFYHKHFMEPVPAGPDDTIKSGYTEEFICYKCSRVGASRITVLPGRTVKVRDDFAYGIICIQGHGKIEGKSLEAPTLIRYGQLTYDEYFISIKAAAEGVSIANSSPGEELVILKHYAKK